MDGKDVWEVAMETENQEVPFDMVKETLRSIRLWIDKLTELSIGIIGGQRVDPNDGIVMKYKMVKQLIVLAAPLLENNLDEIEEFFSNINITKGDIRNSNGWARNVDVYSMSVDYKLDECIQGIEKGLKKYFIPTIKRGQRY